MTINELMARANVPGRPYTVRAMLDWAAERIAELEARTDGLNAHGWRNSFTEDGAECGDAGPITADSMMAGLVAEDRARFHEIQPRSMDDCGEVIDMTPHKETAIDRARRMGWMK